MVQVDWYIDIIEALDKTTNRLQKVTFSVSVYSETAYFHLDVRFSCAAFQPYLKKMTY